MSTLLFPLALVLALVIAANLVEQSKSRQTARLFTIFLASLNVPLVITGFAFTVLPTEIVPFLGEQNLPAFDTVSIGLILFGIGIWGFLCCLPPFRKLLARGLPLAADSPVHLTALILAGFLVGNSAVAIDQDFLREIIDSGLIVSMDEVVFQQAAFVLIGLAGVGLFTRRDGRSAMIRLGLLKPAATHMIMATGVIVLLIVLQATAGAVWTILDPEQAAQLVDANEILLSGVDSITDWLILAVSSGIGEELLFRGALQPVFGLPFTALLFAIVHIQYGLTPLSLVVFFLGLVLGLVRRYSSTTVAIFVHFGYNFALGLLSMLALYLEQFVTP